ncbi:MAG TPA: pyridine nucleotide-disulfide oxidoreductase, partial [Desulfobacteraceae bacterium]|nr:pyridine nucleotide-disulfide oxidoreductase [Desulfobacteraceae bacterium]
MPKRIVVIGAVALGPKAACRFKRLEPESEVTMIDQNHLISYGGCGIPYFISGDISDPGQLRATSFNMLRDEAFFHEAKDIQVLTNTRAVAIDRRAKTVQAVHLPSGKRSVLGYDKLVIATGARPKRLPVPGSDMDTLFQVSSMDEA